MVDFYGTSVGKYTLGGGNWHIFGIFIPTWGNSLNSLQFDEHIFQMGWFNHQLATKFTSWNINHENVGK